MLSYVRISNPLLQSGEITHTIVNVYVTATIAKCSIF